MADQLDEITRLVGDGDDPQVLSIVAISDASVAFAAGRLGDARMAWLRSVELSPGNLVGTLPLAARAALWDGDAAAARADLAALDASGVHGPAVEADRRTIRAGIAALEGRSADALPLYRDALRAWRDLCLVWNEALCGLDMATLLNPADQEVRAAAAEAREILVRLGAAPFVARLDAALARSSDRTGHPAAPRMTSVTPP